MYFIRAAELELLSCYFTVRTVLLELRCWNCVDKIVEDIREAFAKGIRKNYIIPTT